MPKLISDTLNENIDIGIKMDNNSAESALLKFDVVEYYENDVDPNSDVVFYRTTCTTCSTS